MSKTARETSRGGDRDRCNLTRLLSLTCTNAGKKSTCCNDVFCLINRVANAHSQRYQSRAFSYLTDEFAPRPTISESTLMVLFQTSRLSHRESSASAPCVRYENIFLHSRSAWSRARRVCRTTFCRAASMHIQCAISLNARSAKPMKPLG